MLVPARGSTAISIVPGPGELPFNVSTPSASADSVSLSELENFRYLASPYHNDTALLTKDVLSAKVARTTIGCVELTTPDTVKLCASWRRTSVTSETLSFTCNARVPSCFCQTAVTLALPALTPRKGVDSNSLLSKEHNAELPVAGQATVFACRFSTVRSEIITLTVGPSPILNSLLNLLFALRDNRTR